MGQFINVGNEQFKKAIRKRYVDKTMLIAQVNDTLFAEDNLSCVTRCRRFGKSMAAAMLCAYYDKSCDSRELFRGLSIERHPTYEEHLNKYPVIYIDMSRIVTKFGHDIDIVGRMQTVIMRELLQAYPDIESRDDDDTLDLLIRIAEHTGERFIMIVDEWDAICREFKHTEASMDRYVDWLRSLFKNINSAQAFAGAYLTGILPIKRYNTQSALNNIIEYTMMSPGDFAPYFGFTPTEVKMLCEANGMDFDEMEKWYDGYQIGSEPSMFNPHSVMQAITKKRCENYCTTTAAYNDISGYIQRNYQGLKDDIIKMLAGGRCKVNYIRFDNDLREIRSRDDVLTVLIHLGYLSYNFPTKECYIPNLEVAEEMENAVRNTDWAEVIKALDASDELLKAVLDGDEEAVAEGIARIHNREISILSYNNENSLACVLALAFYTARDSYIVHRELHSGKGFVDMAFIPRKGVDLPALVLELKYNKDARTALDQIRQKDYPDVLTEYAGNIILVGINYDKDTKTHTCKIETITI